MKNNYLKMAALAVAMCVTSLLCAEPVTGTSFENMTGQPGFEVGYNYTFETIGTSAKITFELLDEKEGVVAYLWDYTSGVFAEIGMNVTDKTATITLANVAGKTLTFACKFAFAGGMAVTKQFTYTVEGDVEDGSEGEGGEEGEDPVTPPVVDESANTECKGASSENDPMQPGFEVGYNYTFETVGTSVNISFELLDEKEGVVAYLWNHTNGFAETQMAVTGKTGTITLTDQVEGTDLSIACKFAFAGGMAVTKTFTYTVGENCSGDPGSDPDTDPDTNPDTDTEPDTPVIDESKNTACKGSSKAAAEGSTFDVGYHYEFQTSGTIVSIKFELLDKKSGLVAYLFDYTGGGFREIPMDLSGNVATTELTYYVEGEEVALACKFAYAGGMAVTDLFFYTVGDDCSEETDPEPDTDPDIDALPSVEVLEGVYAQDGTIYGVDNMQIFTITGLDVTEMNGNLQGVYVVKSGNKIAKIIVK